MKKIVIRFADDVYNSVVAAAKKDGISINLWVNTKLAYILGSQIRYADVETMGKNSFFHRSYKPDSE
jgi:hypothetical protein